MSRLSELSPMLEQEDLFSKLKTSDKPIVIYGMGDGAAKVIHALGSFGLSFADVFATDAFVRGQSFMGVTVKTYAQCRELYGNFIVLVGFSSSLPEVIEHVKSIAAEQELYIPDINVYGDPAQVFDYTYFRDHLEQLEQIYSLLSDAKSKSFFVDLIRYKVSGNPEILWEMEADSSRYYRLTGSVNTFCDLGAYIGDTIREQKQYHPELHTVIAVEPELRHCKKLEAHKDEVSRLFVINAAAYDREGDIDFSGGKGRGSSHSMPAIEGVRPLRAKPVPTVSLDQLVFAHKIEKVDLIKYDVEGCEHKALLGSLQTILGHKPHLIVSLYHNHNDLIELPLLLADKLQNARFYLSRKQKCFPGWEVELTIIQ